MRSKGERLKGGGDNVEDLGVLGLECEVDCMKASRSGSSLNPALVEGRFEARLDG